jgi:4-amino-4-deoxy-L-arabinose transferase-like glycosyltransferase
MGTQAATRISIVVMIAAAVASALIGGASARHLETVWDERVDHEIALGLLAHPLTGARPAIDGSQTRLPMYVSALAFALTGRDDLAVSRRVSSIFAAITVLATGALGRRLFGPLAGALAAVLLAFSPYFLAFGRIAMTEGDVFFACFTTLAAYAFVRYARQPTPTSWLLGAISAALAVGAKLYAVVPLTVLAVVVLTSGRQPGLDVIRSVSGRRHHARRLRALLAVAVGVVVVGAALALLSRQARVQERPEFARRLDWAAWAAWAALLLTWCGIVAFVLRRRVLAAGGAARLIGMAVLAAVTFFALMPVHLVEHGIAREIARLALRWNDEWPLARWGDHLRLYSGIVLIKLTVPLGLVTALALLLGAVRSLREARWRVCMWPAVAYVAFLCLLPMRQTFYLMGVYPLLMILTAAGAGVVREQLRAWRRAGPAVWVVGVAALLAHLGTRVAAAYPFYHLYGYDTVGNRWLAAESRGYRNLIQTPSDGVESLIRWCEMDQRVKEGDRVVSYLWEAAIIERVLPPTRRYVFVPRGVTPASEAVPPPPSIADADFVLLHINNLLGYGDRPPDWPPEDLLRGRFRVVYTVRRGPMEVGRVFGRMK